MGGEAAGNGCGRIYVDFDDVLCQTARGLTALLEREFGKRVAFEEIASFDLGISFGLTAREVDRLMRLAHEPGVLGELEPIAGADAVLGEWMAAGHDVIVVTGRPPVTLATSQAWLERHRVPCSGLIFVDKYSRLHADDAGATTLSLEELCAMDFSLAVEDAPRMVDFLAAHMAMPVVLFDQPWNAGVAASSGRHAGARVERCRGWEEIGERFPRP